MFGKKAAYVTTNYRRTVRDYRDWQEYLTEFVRTDPRNHLPEGDCIPIFDSPAVGIASADDPLFAELSKPEIVAPRHVRPDFWIPDARTVISFFAPFSKEIKAAYKKGERLPPLEWVSGRLNGEVFINVLRRAILRLVEKQGGRAVIPNLDLRYWAEDWLPIWSERHVGFIAGVGTFGLHAGLLTEKGAAGRMGSVVTNLPLPARYRAYKGVYDYCLWKSESRCRACIRRCPAGAINGERKDHILCASNGANHILPAYLAWGYHACGHCQNNLPCSNGIPRKKRKHTGSPLPA